VPVSVNRSGCLNVEYDVDRSPDRRIAHAEGVGTLDPFNSRPQRRSAVAESTHDPHRTAVLALDKTRHLGH
jgi:hypothetical protein